MAASAIAFGVGDVVQAAVAKTTPSKLERQRTDARESDD
jgi:hypothetical protein